MNTKINPELGRNGAEQKLDGYCQNTPSRPACQALLPFFKSGEVTEIRALGLYGRGPWEGWAKGVVSGYFDDPDKLKAAVKRVDGLQKATGIYFTLNPVDPALLARASNRLIAAKATTTDDQVVCHRWFFGDIDPARPAGISSSDNELEKALKRSEEIADYLHSQGWPDPVMAHSGNGGHLLYRLEDLPNTDSTKELKRKALQALSLKFGSMDVQVDQAVFNASRIVKLYGTWSRKGDSLPDRPHRKSSLKTIPDPIVPVTVEQLQWLADQTPKEKPTHTRNQLPNSGKLDVRAYLSHYGVEISKIKSEDSRTIYGLRHCVFDPNHTSNDSSIIQMADGKLLYQCFHNSCQDRTWHEARERVSGSDSLVQFIDGYVESPKAESILPGQGNPSLKGQDEIQNGSSPTEKFSFDTAKEEYPRKPFPWSVLPESIAASLQQLARSCATSATSLPGAAIAIFASTIGNTVNVYPKKSWHEPLIFWCGDIRPSGEGKTPPPRALMHVLYEAQKMANEVYDLEMKA